MAYRTTTRGPKPRKTVLYYAWANMKSRVTCGGSTKAPWVYQGLPFAFPKFACFRCYALVYGFNKVKRSPERIKPKLGYVPGNIHFVRPIDNASTSAGRSWYSDDAVRGQEPPREDYVPF